MYESDSQYFSRFELDPPLDNDWEDPYGFDFSDDEVDPFDDEKILDDEDLNLEDDFLFEN
jgi:hypothetical protein